MRPEVKQELERLREKNGGTLWPEQVVDAAKRKKSPLHPYFEWDDSEAAKRYRLWQARMLIRVSVSVIEGTEQPVRTYVSLQQDRGTRESYRAVADVMEDPVQRAALLDQALNDLERWQGRYNQLQELAEVFDAADRVRTTRKAA